MNTAHAIVRDGLTWTARQQGGGKDPRTIGWVGVKALVQYCTNSVVVKSSQFTTVECSVFT